MFADPAAPMQLPVDNKTVRMKVWMDIAAQIVMKMEGGIDTPNSGDVFADFTTPGEWQELTWDFSAVLEDDAQHERMTLIFNFEGIPSEDRTYYFDDIVIGDAECNILDAVFSPIKVDQLKVSPNPAMEFLRIENANDIFTFQIHDMMGRSRGMIQLNGQEQVQLDVNYLEPGVYLLTAYNQDGKLAANARFVKQ